MSIISTLTGKTYKESEVVNFYNYSQALSYMKHGALPVDILPSSDKIIFVFMRKDHERLKKVAQVERIRDHKKK